MADPTVFIVDDDVAVRTAFRRLLLPLRHPVRMYGSAEQFLANTDSGACGCLVLDVRLPGMSGLQLQERMAEAGWKLPIIFITAQDDGAVRDAAVRGGAAAYLKKPTDATDLLDSVRRAMGTASDP